MARLTFEIFICLREVAPQLHSYQPWHKHFLSDVRLRYVVHGRGCNPHRSRTTVANLEITSLWRHW